MCCHASVILPFLSSSRCRVANRAAPEVSYDKESPRHHNCAELFQEETSVFKSCFYRVSPEEFMNMCLRDPTQDSDEGLCKIAAAYSHECKRVEVHVRMPSKCGELQ